ncbi:unnamed protein product [Owenia fusiformis]|uniref:Uncharacterized protein n=1 Tax=Owenia fusiformis TaxID=6347 RepID=A0A8J1UXK1_OWEFU|nr:unnamed protein product [Owenia fusiformis]
MNNKEQVLKLSLLLIATCVAMETGVETLRAPCYNCEFFELAHQNRIARSEHHRRLVHQECRWPCPTTECPETPHDVPGCRDGVNIIKDGCGCCFMCGRQQGDTCNHEQLCDEQKGLYCDFQLDNGVRGVCRAKEANPCYVPDNGKFYRDGESFQPDCRRKCTCQNGHYGCVSNCPQEERKPSNVSCINPQLISINNSCCKDWICPDYKENSGHRERDVTTFSPFQVTTSPRPCKKDTSAWSACSVTCGQGVSIRVTNDNGDCQPIKQVRMCEIRPCDLNDQHLTGRHCKHTIRAKEKKPIQIKDCTSVKKFQPKYCSTCKKRTCCLPEMASTKSLEFVCKDGKHTMKNIMWIKNCKCQNTCLYN